MKKNYLVKPRADKLSFEYGHMTRPVVTELKQAR